MKICFCVNFTSTCSMTETSDANDDQCLFVFLHLYIKANYNEWWFPDAWFPKQKKKKKPERDMFKVPWRISSAVISCTVVMESSTIAVYCTRDMPLTLHAECSVLSSRRWLVLLKSFSFPCRYRTPPAEAFEGLFIHYFEGSCQTNVL